MRRGVVAALALVGAIAACGGPKPAQPPAPAAPDAGAPVAHADGGAHAPRPAAPEDEDAKMIAKMLKRVAAIRGLPAKKAVPGVSLGRSALIGKIKDKVAREIPAEVIVHEGEWLKLFGFVPVEFDYLDTMMKLLEAQLAGFYEPKDGTMYLAEDLDALNAEATLAHELVHALQDQHWDLKSRSDYKEGASDEQLAMSALAEGEATSVMTDIMLAKIARGKTALDVDEDDFEEQLLGGMNQGPSAKAPHVLRTSLAAPYIEGTRFVHAVRRQAGWKGVDAVWARPPVTTEQILHLDKWQKSEGPLNVPIPTFATLGAGFKVDIPDTSGELGIRLAFAEWMGEDRAKEAAADWGGDRGTLYLRGSEVAAGVRLRYDAGTPGAKRAFAAIVASWPRAIGKASMQDASFFCVERKDTGPIAVALKGDDVFLAAGPVETKPRWASKGTCKLSKAWAAEVLK